MILTLDDTEEQDGRVVSTPAFGSVGPKFDPRQQPLVQLSLRWLNSHIQALESLFSLLQPRLSDETLNRGPESIA